MIGRRLCGVGWIAVLLVAVSVSALATLRIDDFDVRLHVTDEGLLEVSERLTVTFVTPHHGIERMIPVSYTTDTLGARVAIDLDVDAVTLDNASVPVRRRGIGSTTTLRIGDPDRTITGTHIYQIDYTVGRALIFHEDYVELYWNATGNEWRIPIDRATASVELPASVVRDDVRTTSYVATYGGNTRGRPSVVAADGSILFETGRLSPGEGLTIDVAIPRDQLPFDAPTWLQTAGGVVSDNWPVVLPVVALGLMLLVWARSGRDPRKRTIAPAYAPPRDLHAGAVGVLIDDRVDLRDLSAMMIELAVGGHMRIEEVRDDVENSRSEKPTDPDDYRLVRLSKAVDQLSDTQRLLLDTLFDADRQDERLLSSLENEFYKTLPTLKSRLYGELVHAGFYPNNPERVRRSYVTLGVVIGLAGAMIGIWSSWFLLALCAGLCGVVVLAFSPIMPRKTQSGVRKLEEVLGLSEYIGRAEVERLEFHHAPEKGPDLFSKLLPYAMALNLTSAWTRQFEGLVKEPPDWYLGASPVFHGHMFALSMGRLSTGMSRAFTSTPRASTSGRSAWGGGSFGGGFSGGGFGGGGGGGW